MLRLQIVVGSTREGRSADLVVPWVVQHAKEHGGFAVELLDLRDWVLPLFAEHAGTIGDWADPTYSEPVVRRWNHKIAEGEAYLFITSEYNHSMPGALKNAIDNVFASLAFRGKPAGFIGYSAGISAGVRAVEHLASVAIEAELVPMRNSVLIPQVAQSMAGGVPKDPTTGIALTILLEDLAWWGKLLAAGRAEGMLPPGATRLRAMMAAGAPTR